jgi:hypothetical protein
VKVRSALFGRFGNQGDRKADPTENGHDGPEAPSYPLWHLPSPVEQALAAVGEKRGRAKGEQSPVDLPLVGKA